MNGEENEFPNGEFVHGSRRNLTFQLYDDGSCIVRVNGLVDAVGTYVINGNQYTEDTDYLPCKHARTAANTWAYDGKRLTFQLASEDDCTERRECLDGVTWIRQG